MESNPVKSEADPPCRNANATMPCPGKGSKAFCGSGEHTMCKPLRLYLGLLWIGLALVAGCQTWHPEAGLTLPSPDYLSHPPQFIPQSPTFPLPKEMESLQKATQAQTAGTKLGI